MDNVYLLIGGNLGNRVENLANALTLLGKRAGKISRCSAIYQTAAWGIIDQKPFLNQVVELSTNLDAHKLLDVILQVEKELGRVRREKNGPRLIDIDILFFGREIINDQRLTIPHPLLHVRRFALAPMNNIRPDLEHPLLHKTIGMLLAECADTLEVQIYTASL